MCLFPHHTLKNLELGSTQSAYFAHSIVIHCVVFLAYQELMQNDIMSLGA